MAGRASTKLRLAAPRWLGPLNLAVLLIPIVAGALRFSSLAARLATTPDPADVADRAEPATHPTSLERALEPADADGSLERARARTSAALEVEALPLGYGL